MNCYIDFDNTLYNTPLLTERLLNSIVNSIKEKIDLNSENLYEECLKIFNQNISHVELAKYFSNKYNLDVSIIIDNLNNILLNGSDLVFDDVIPFFKKLKEKGYKLYLLTHCKNSLEYQSMKITGSKLSNIFDALYLTSIPKYMLDINYENGIFIDDNPTDLLGLYSNNAKQVIRLRRKENKYSVTDLDNKNIKEYLNLAEINIEEDLI